MTLSRVYLGLALGLGALTGCVPQQQLTQQGSITITFADGRKFNSAAAALDAHRADGAEQIAAVPVFADRLAGKALVILPDSDRLRPLAAAGFKGDYNNQMLDYEIRLRQLLLNNVVGALRKSNLFDLIDLIERNDTENPGFEGHDYLVWYQIGTTGANHTGNWYGRWQVRRAPNSGAEPASADPGAPKREQLATFVQSVRGAAARLGGPAVAGGAAVASAAARGVLTGIAVGTQGEVVTNDHGVNSCGSVKAVVDHQTLPAKILARDRENDLALLRIEHAFATPASFRDGSPIKQGETVVAIGYPLGPLLASEATVTTGAVSALTGMRDDSRFLQFTAPIQQGNSGGPLLDASGHVTGLVTSKLNAQAVAALTGDIPQNVNFALKSGVVRNFLEANGVAYKASPSGREARPAEIAEQAKSFTVQVQCWS
jgi:S1-C subfamily serine protease